MARRGLDEPPVRMEVCFVERDELPRPLADRVGQGNGGEQRTGVAVQRVLK